MAKQLLHLVFGGELTDLSKVEFRDLDKIHFVGLYPNFAKAREAHMRYFVVHLHKMLQPELEAGETLSAPAKPARTAPAARPKAAKTGKAGPSGRRK
jgi:hypothetical protein